jgi:uncharacterized protein
MMVIEILVDADACPVKDEIYKVAARFNLKTIIIANSYINVPRDALIERVVVSDKFDAADDWIAERCSPFTIVITSDVPLAHRCVKVGASVLAPNGKKFDENSIGMQLATRDLMDNLRAGGQITGGPKPFSARDRSAFLQSLDLVITSLLRRNQ